MILLLRTDRTQAYLLKDILAHHGIKAHVFNENTSSIVGTIPSRLLILTSRPRSILGADGLMR